MTHYQVNNAMVAYRLLGQQCSQNPLHDESCTGYADAFFDQQCDNDVFYSTNCDEYDELRTRIYNVT